MTVEEAVAALDEITDEDFGTEEGHRAADGVLLALAPQAVRDAYHAAEVRAGHTSYTDEKPGWWYA